MTKRCLVAFLATAAVVPAQSIWSATPHRASVRVVGERSAELRGERAVELPAGTYTVHFGTDAMGKPMSLPVACDDGDTVRVAIERAGPVAEHTVPPQDADWQAADLPTQPPTHLRITGAEELADYRIAATVRTSGDDGVFGLIARYSDDDHRYRLVWDRSHHELRLERRLGADDMVMTRVSLPPQDDVPHTLALQVHGFRLTAFVDDELLLQEFDGALTRGRAGTFWSSRQPTWEHFAIEPVAAPRGSAAIVRRPGQATLHAGVVVSPGHCHVLEVAIDRPHALVPSTASGLELWLLQRPALPTCLMADWRDSLGAGGIGDVPDSGQFVSTLRWPDLPALRHQAALVRALLVTLDGTTLVGASPSVPLVF